MSNEGRERDELLLSHEEGEVLAPYLHNSRPSCSIRHLFIRRYVPLHGLQVVTVTFIVRQAFSRAGIDIPGRGAAHLLRHALESAILRSGASLEDIGPVQRHWSVDSTRVYAKVDLDALCPPDTGMVGRRVMTDLQTLRADYLTLRSRLASCELTMAQASEPLRLAHASRAVFIATVLALERDTELRDVHPAGRAHRLSEVSQFARYAHAIDPRHELPP